MRWGRAAIGTYSPRSSRGCASLSPTTRIWLISSERSHRSSGRPIGACGRRWGRAGEFALNRTAWVETRAWRQRSTFETSVLQVSPVGSLADELVEKRYRAVRQRARKFDRLDAEGRHALRIVVKKMRYAADVFESVYAKKRVRRYVKRLAALQDDLGLLNDIATAEKLVRDLPLPKGKEEALKRAAALVTGWCGHTVTTRVPKLGKRLKRLRQAEPFWRQPA